MKLNQAVILAGGKGTRLSPYTHNLPKPLVKINSVPFLDYLIHSLFGAGFMQILILVGYKREHIVNRYSNIKYNNLNIDFSLGDVNDRTGKRIIDAYDKLDEKFLLLYGDNYWPIEIEKMALQYKQNNTPIMTTVYSNEDGKGEYGYENNIIVNKHSNIVEGYDKERKDKKANGVDIGYFIIKKTYIDKNINDNLSFERDMVPRLLKKRKISAYMTDRRYYYITDVPALKNYERAVKKNNFSHLPEDIFQ